MFSNNIMYHIKSSYKRKEEEEDMLVSQHQREYMWARLPCTDHGHPECNNIWLNAFLLEGGFHKLS